MRRFRIAGWVLAAVVALFAAAGLVLWIGSGPVVAWAIEHPVSAAMGRQITLSGRLSIAWGSPTRIVAEGVRVANAPWGTAPDMLNARRLEIELYPWSLVTGPTRIALADVEGASLLLETNAEGVGNWKFSNAAPKKRKHFPVLQQLVVHDSALRWHNGRTNARTEIDVAALSFAAPDARGPVKVDGEGRFQDMPAKLAATVGPLAMLRSSTTPYPVTLHGSLSGMTLDINGQVAEPLDFSGVDLRLSLAGEGLDALSDKLGVPLPALPAFRGTAKLEGGQGDWRLDAMSLKLGASDLEGGIAINTNTRVPRLTANFTSSYLDLADFMGAVGGRPTKAGMAPPSHAPGGRVIPDMPIPVHKLPDVDAQLDFYGTRIRSSGGVPLQAVTLGLSLAKGELTLKPLRFHVASGDLALNGHFTPWVKEGAPRLDADLSLSQVNLQQLFDRPGMPGPLRKTRGILGGDMKIRTTGVSLRQFLGRMDGEAGIFMQHGEFSQLMQKLAPIDVLETLGVLLKGDKALPINCLVSHFDVKDGVATATTLLFDTSDTEIVGSGNVNFASETLYLDLDPYNKTPVPLSLRTPILARGTFAKPQFSINPTGLLARLGAAVGLGIVFPPAAVLALADTGLGSNNACARAFARHPPGSEAQSGGGAPGK
ncbi:MAG TPA: AsmA family protein [Stellaceae bacterium]|nr:AsmA family protein [Stellaceae bacterium]